MTACNATKYDHPDDPQPMVCALALDHDGDHQPTRYDGGVWTTWADDEAVAS